MFTMTETGIRKALISYSAGTDSTTLAFYLCSLGFKPTLAVFDDGPDNDPNDKWFDSTKRPDLNSNFEELVWYQNYYARVFKFDTMKIRFPTLNSLVVENPKPASRESTAFTESIGNVMYSGYKTLMALSLLSVAAAKGYECVAFGHLPYNDQYDDSSPIALSQVRNLFADLYGARLQYVPTLLNPWWSEPFGTKESVLKLAHKLQVPLHMTYSCRRGRFVSHEHGWEHCGTCENCLERKRAFESLNKTHPELGIEDGALWAS